MTMRILLLAILFLNASACFAQPDSAAGFILFPPGLHIQPLKANVQEPRLGLFKFSESSGMKVDIGNSIDVAAYENPGNYRLTLGIDFMAYAFVTGAQGFRLQIDAVDGFFGGNISASKFFPSGTLQARLRMLHQSAHLVDGHYDVSAHQWIDNRQPLPFTRDFGELIVAHVLQPCFGNLRYYGGFSYATLVRPTDVQRLAYLAGIESATDRIIGSVAGQPTNLFLAYSISLNGTPEYAATNQFQLGIKFGRWNGKGAVLYVGYYSGRHMFAEYFDERLSTLGAGFTVDFE